MPSPDTGPGVLPEALVAEGERIMRICNACRYCEGYCAVFPAMERRLSFGEADLTYLANLCHDCGECLDACQYAPPHEFNVHVPRTLARVRLATYRGYARPSVAAAAFERPGAILWLAGLVSPLAFLAAVVAWRGRDLVLQAHGSTPGAFYQVIPHPVMIGFFTVVGLAVAIVLGRGVAAVWRDTGARFGQHPRLSDLARALGDAARLRYLHGGGVGCPYPGEVPSQARRWLHHATFYGFALCFAATCVAALYHHVWGWHAPYPLFSLPVVLGCIGGAGLVVGPAGLLALKAVRSREAPDAVQTELDETFLWMLLLTSITGFLLLMLRAGGGMGAVLAVHLGVVFGLFVTLPYGKFVHAGYRLCALVVHAVEERAGRGTSPHH